MAGGCAQGEHMSDIIISIFILIPFLSIFLSYTEAFVSLATNDYYARGALALGHSIRKTHTTRKLSLLITSSVTPEIR